MVYSLRESLTTAWVLERFVSHYSSIISLDEKNKKIPDQAPTTANCNNRRELSTLDKDAATGCYCNTYYIWVNSY